MPFHLGKHAYRHRLTLRAPQLIFIRDTCAVEVPDGQAVVPKRAQRLPNFRPVQIAPQTDGDNAVEYDCADASLVDQRSCTDHNRVLRVERQARGFCFFGIYRTGDTSDRSTPCVTSVIVFRYPQSLAPGHAPPPPRRAGLTSTTSLGGRPPDECWRSMRT